MLLNIPLISFHCCHFQCVAGQPLKLLLMPSLPAYKSLYNRQTWDAAIPYIRTRLFTWSPSTCTVNKLKSKQDNTCWTHSNDAVFATHLRNLKEAFLLVQLHTYSTSTPVIFKQCAVTHWCALDDPLVCCGNSGEGCVMGGLSPLPTAWCVLIMVKNNNWWHALPISAPCQCWNLFKKVENHCSIQLRTLCRISYYQGEKNQSVYNIISSYIHVHLSGCMCVCT